MAQQSSVTETIGRRLRALRAQRGLSAQGLADLCDGLGRSDLKRQVISNIENGRRAYVAVDEALVLAYALNVAPVLLLMPSNGADALQIAPDVSMPTTSALAWITGEEEPADRERRLEWRKAMDPVRLHREVRQRFDKVAQAEARSDDQLYRAELRELGRVLDLMIERAVKPPAIPAAWVNDAVKAGWLDHADEVPTR